MSEERIEVDVSGVGSAIAVSVICTVFIGIGLGFVFGMNAQGCSIFEEDNVIRNVCACSAAAVLKDGITVTPASNCTLRVLVSHADGTRDWVDTHSSCSPR